MTHHQTPVRIAGGIALVILVSGAGVAAATTFHTTRASLPAPTVRDVNVLVARESAVLAQLRAFQHLGKKAPVVRWEARLKATEAAQATAEATLNADLASAPLGGALKAPAKSVPRKTQPAMRQVGTGHASGDYALATASGTANNPSAIQLSITATPSQSGVVSWDLICTENGGGVGSKTGQSTLVLPTVEPLPLPAPSSSCIVSSGAQISGSGTVAISIESSP